MPATAVRTRSRKGPRNFAEAKALGRLTTVEETAMPLLGVTNARLYDMARRKLVPHVRLGRTVKFSPEVLEKWVADGGRSLPGGWKRKAD
jgi:excisionase family DNA binding protein